MPKSVRFFLLFLVNDARLRSNFKNFCFVFHRGFQTLENNKSTRPKADETRSTSFWNITCYLAWLVGLPAYLKGHSRCYVTFLSSLLLMGSRLQGNSTMWSMRTRMKSLEYTTLEIQPLMNASRKSSKLTKMEYLSVRQTTMSIKYTSEVSLSTVSLWNASVIIFLPQNAAAGFYQCPNKGGVVIWVPSLIAILCPEKGPKQDDPV